MDLLPLTVRRGKRGRSDRSCPLRGWLLPSLTGAEEVNPNAGAPLLAAPARPEEEPLPGAVLGGAGLGAAAAGPGRRDAEDSPGAPPPPPRTHRPCPTRIISYFSDEALLFLPVLPFWSRAWNI